MTFRRILAASLILVAAGCSKPAPEPSPPPVAAPSPRPAPPVAAPRYDNWMDAPATAGDWSYGTNGTASFARFSAGAGGPRFTLACQPSARRVTLMRHEAGASPASAMTIRAEEGTRALATQRSADRGTLEVALPANDPLLAAMAFSKGRFAVEAEGLPTLYLPAWAEVTRVIEDCL